MKQRKPWMAGNVSVVMHHGVGRFHEKREFILQPDGSWDLWVQQEGGRNKHRNNVTTDHMLALVKEHAELYAGQPDTDEKAYTEAVQLCLDSNNDQPGYDEASAVAAVDAMLWEESGSITTVLARLRGEQ